MNKNIYFKAASSIRRAMPMTILKYSQILNLMD